MLNLMQMFFIFTLCLSVWETFNGKDYFRLMVSITSMCVTYVSILVWCTLG